MRIWRYICGSRTSQISQGSSRASVFFYIDKNKRAKGSEGSQVHTYGRALDVKNILKVDIFLSLVCNIIFIFRNCDDE